MACDTLDYIGQSNGYKLAKLADSSLKLDTRTLWYGYANVAKCKHDSNARSLGLSTKNANVWLRRTSIFWRNASDVKSGLTS